MLCMKLAFISSDACADSTSPEFSARINLMNKKSCVFMLCFCVAIIVAPASYSTGLKHHIPGGWGDFRIGMPVVEFAKEMKRLCRYRDNRYGNDCTSSEGIPFSISYDTRGFFSKKVTSFNIDFLYGKAIWNRIENHFGSEFKEINRGCEHDGMVQPNCAIEYLGADRWVQLGLWKNQKRLKRELADFDTRISVAVYEKSY